MIFAFVFVLAQAAAPPAAPAAEPRGEIPAGASIHARKQPESARPNHIEGSLVAPGRYVNAEDVVDELVDEFAVDIARLGAGHISPVLLERVRVSPNMNPEYVHIFEARL